MIDITQLQYFKQVVDSHNIQTAAEKLFISRQALTKQIRNIEDELGAALVVSKHGVLETTDAGRQFYDEASRLLASYRQFQRNIDRIRSTIVSLGFAHGVKYVIKSTMLTEFGQVYPGTHVTIEESSTDDVVRMVQEEDIAIALLGTMPDFVSEFDYTLIVETPIMLMVPERFSCVRKGYITLEDLATIPLTTAGKHNHLQRFIEQECNRKQLMPNIVFSSSCIDILTEYALREKYALFAFPEGFGRVFEGYKLLPLMLDQDPKFGVYMIKKKNTSYDKNVSNLWNFIKNYQPSLNVNREFKPELLMEPIKLYVSVPFRADGNEEEHVGCLKKFSVHQIDTFLSALEQEIISAAKDAKDCQVVEIEFGGGSFTHLGNNDTLDIVKLLGKYFRLSPSVRVKLSATPTNFNFFRLSSVRQLGNSTIYLETPSLDNTSLENYGFKCRSVDVINALDCCFQNGFKRFVCVVSPACNRNLDVFLSSLKKILLRKPEGIIFNSQLTPEQLKAVSALLLDDGYKPYKPTDFLSEVALLYSDIVGEGWFRSEPSSSFDYKTQIGLGPYAVSVFDGKAIRTNPDFDYYCANSNDFSKLVIQDT